MASKLAHNSIKCMLRSTAFYEKQSLAMSIFEARLSLSSPEYRVYSNTMKSKSSQRKAQHCTEAHPELQTGPDLLLHTLCYACLFLQAGDAGLAAGFPKGPLRSLVLFLPGVAVGHA
eukprot:scaffold150410_cov20-Tisochrysis_lutea.AAC.1